MTAAALGSQVGSDGPWPGGWRVPVSPASLPLFWARVHSGSFSACDHVSSTFIILCFHKPYVLTRSLGQKSKPKVLSPGLFNVLTKTTFGSLLQNGLGFFSVFMCNFCCVPWKYFKESVYKVLFCVLKQRGDCLSSLRRLCWRDPPVRCSLAPRCHCPSKPPVHSAGSHAWAQADQRHFGGKTAEFGSSPLWRGRRPA